MMQIKTIGIANNQAINLSDIPEHNYELFAEINLELLKGNPSRHCVSYFGYPVGEKVKLICCIADDDIHKILVSSSLVEVDVSLNSFTFQSANFEKYEREIHENFGINYTDHPWLKPLRYSFNRANP